MERKILMEREVNIYMLEEEHLTTRTFLTDSANAFGTSLGQLTVSLSKETDFSATTGAALRSVGGC